MGGGGGGGQAPPPPQIIQPPPPPPPQIINPPAAPPPPNPDQNVAEIQKAANIFTGKYQTEVVDPTLERMQEQEQTRVPLEYGAAGFFPEQQQEYLQQASTQVSDLVTNTSLTAELAAQQSLMQAGLANMQTMMSAAQQRAQYQQAQYLAYQQAVPGQALGFQSGIGGGAFGNQDYMGLNGGVQGAEPNASTLLPFMGGMG